MCLNIFKNVYLYFWGAFDNILKAERSGKAVDNNGKIIRDSEKCHGTGAEAPGTKNTSIEDGFLQNIA